MAAVFWATGFSLLLQGCWCSVGQQDRGCMTWTTNEDNVCCEACYPGHHLAKDCGPSPKDLCVPCEHGTFSGKSKNKSCTRCAQCVGAQVYVKQCTATSDTQCGCKEGLTCGDDRCSFCVKRCDRGQEPTEKRSCRTCPAGTFNDQSHQMCKPWSTKCPDPEQMIVAMGDAFFDITCANVSGGLVHKPKKPDPTEQSWPLVLSVVTSVALMAVGIIITISSIMAKKRKAGEEKPIPKTPIIRTPTDDDDDDDNDPRTLIAVECSFHEAKQERGSHSESSHQLIV
ncbi:tumor necrosis factor receptor superfamily member 9-like [Cyclopterus lumpus]|uniref:Tumor necrosis factor receptor superfamily, member 9a n=1 Tax=Cyclopterus lumpus TaxID=8103 RepID=A0A8C2ZPI6_CYCLU|nr:tumor necrosis factor receptor superfamily member 9-like [Cyclopterus lumpus]